MARDYAHIEQDPPATLAVVIPISIAVEICRRHLHPETATAVTYPNLLATCSVLANIAFHVWNEPIRPSAYVKAAVSAFLGEAAMPTGLLIVLKLGESILLAIVRAVTEFTAP